MCGNCGKKQLDECVVGMNSFYGCGKGGHMVKDCPNVRGQVKGSSKTELSGPRSEAPKRNSFYALKTRGEQESSLDVVTYML